MLGTLETANILNISRSTVVKLAKSGCLPCLKKGTHRRFSLKEIYKYKKKFLCVNPWEKERVPYGFWKNKDNCKKYLCWLGNKLSFKTPEDWYKLTTKDVIKNYGSGIFQYYYLFDLLFLCYPDFNWHEWLTADGVKNWNKKTILKYFNWLEVKLKINSIEDWYGILQKDIVKNNGWGLLTNKFNSSNINFIKWAIPDFEWKDWLFKGGVSDNYWSNKKNRKRYMLWLGEKLSFNKLEDWYNVDKNDFNKNKGSGLLSHFYKNTPHLAVIDNFKYDWDVSKFYKGMKKQKRIYAFLVNIYGKNNVLWNHKCKNIRFAKSNKPIELDIYIPHINFAIEYQGEQHFFPKWGEKVLADTQLRDKEKRELVEKSNIKLLEISYEWNGDLTEIFQKIQKIINV